MTPTVAPQNKEERNTKKVERLSSAEDDSERNVLSVITDIPKTTALGNPSPGRMM